MPDLPIFENGASFGNQILTNLLTGVAPTDGVNVQQLNDAINSIPTGLRFIGPYDAATNTPDLETPVSGAVKKGYLYIVSVAGLFFTESMEVGDVLVSKIDDPSSLADWITINKNIDPAIFGNKVHVVGDIAEANLLTGLKKGDLVYITNITPDLQERLQVVKGITDGAYGTSDITDIGYKASGRVFKNEGTADLTTSILLNNTPERLRARTTLPNPPVGGFQMVNTKGVIKGDSLFLEMVDPRGTDFTAGSKVPIYEVTCNISFRRSGGNSTFEFHFAKENGLIGPDPSIIVDSSRIRVNNNDVFHISFSMQLQLRDTEQVGVYVERTAGNANIVVERFELLIDYVAQQGYL